MKKLLTASLWICAATSALAQAAWPDKPITLIVPFPPGGVADTVARPVADAPWKTLAEFVADAKSKPSAYNYGSSGHYGTMHVPMEMLKAGAGFRMNWAVNWRAAWACRPRPWSSSVCRRSWTR